MYKILLVFIDFSMSLFQQRNLFTYSSVLLYHHLYYIHLCNCVTFQLLAPIGHIFYSTLSPSSSSSDADAKPAKLRKYDGSYLQFGFTENNGETKDDRPKCVMYLQVLANEALSQPRQSGVSPQGTWSLKFFSSERVRNTCALVPPVNPWYSVTSFISTSQFHLQRFTDPQCCERSL